MQAQLIINGTDISAYLAEGGITQSPIYRQDRTVTTLDGIEHRSNIQKVQENVDRVKGELDELKASLAECIGKLENSK